MESVVDIINNKLKFNNKDVLIIIDEKNNPWFKAKDIANILEYIKTDKAFKHIDEDDKKILHNLNTSNLEFLKGNEKSSIFINESGLYSFF